MEEIGINENLENELNKQFKKGDKARGRALVLFAIAQIEIDKAKKEKIMYDYDKENDILFMNWGGKSKASMELFNGNLILDANKKGEIVGFEIMNFKERVKNG